jgi:3-hydroxybutyryl-CoA dehydratase
MVQGPVRDADMVDQPLGQEPCMSDVLYLEDLEVSKSWKSPARTLSESDIVSFACLTGDFDPLHVDHEFAAQTPYGKPIAHGLLGLSFMAGLSSTFPRVRTIALVRVDNWSFHRPVFIGDTLHVVTEVESITPRGRRSGEVVWFRKLINQRGECVQSGRIVTLVSSQAFLPRNSAVPAMKSAKLKPNPAKVELATEE